jgi:uncharacterized protein
MRAAPLIAVPLLLACVSAAPPPTPKQPSPARTFLELTHTDALGRHMVDQIVRQVRPDLPNVPATFWDDFVKNVDARAILDDLAPVYEKHFTPDELAELVKFYQSPVGRKLVQVQPQLNRDTLKAGQAFGTRVTKDLMRQLKEKKYLR